jgi:hypothetical protein
VNQGGASALSPVRAAGHRARGWPSWLRSVHRSAGLCPECTIVADPRRAWRPRRRGATIELVRRGRRAGMAASRPVLSQRP